MTLLEFKRPKRNIAKRMNNAKYISIKEKIEILKIELDNYKNLLVGDIIYLDKEFFIYYKDIISKDKFIEYELFENKIHRFTLYNPLNNKKGIILNINDVSIKNDRLSISKAINSFRDDMFDEIVLDIVDKDEVDSNLLAHTFDCFINDNDCISITNKNTFAARYINNKSGRKAKDNILRAFSNLNRVIKNIKKKEKLDYLNSLRKDGIFIPSDKFEFKGKINLNDLYNKITDRDPFIYKHTTLKFVFNDIGEILEKFSLINLGINKFDNKIYFEKTLGKKNPLVLMDDIELDIYSNNMELQLLFDHKLDLYKFNKDNKALIKRN